MLPPRIRYPLLDGKGLPDRDFVFGSRYRVKSRGEIVLREILAVNVHPFSQGRVDEPLPDVFQRPTTIELVEDQSHKGICVPPVFGWADILQAFREPVLLGNAVEQSEMSCGAGTLNTVNVERYGRLFLFKIIDRAEMLQDLGDRPFLYRIPDARDKLTVPVAAGNGNPYVLGHSN